MNNAPFLGALLNYYGNYGRKVMMRLNQIAEDVNKRQYGPEKLISDSVDLWVDGMFGWWSSLLVSASAEVPEVFFRLRPEAAGMPGEKSKQAVLPIAIPANAVVSTTDIARLGPPPARLARGAVMAIPKANVACEVSPFGDLLTVKLRGIQRRAAPLAPGLYQGLVYAEDRLLAIVHVAVADA